MGAIGEIAHLADVPVDIEVELDRRTLSVRALLELRAGSSIRLTRAAGENVDVYVGGALAGCGEIVVTETSIGVRITDFAE